MLFDAESGLPVARNGVRVGNSSLDDISIDGNVNGVSGQPRVVRAHHSCLGFVGRHCGPMLLFLTLGAVLGGMIIRQNPQIEYEIINNATLWSFQDKCDASLVSNYNLPRVVQDSYCVEHHDRTSTFATKLNGDSINFVVIGDWGRDGMCCQRDVAVEMGYAARSIGASAVLNTGDNFYPLGIPSATHEQVKTSWQNVYNVDGLKNLTWYSVLGNHDYYGSASAELEMHKLYPHWHMPDRYYAHEFTSAGNDVTILGVFLDTTPMLSAYTNTANVKKFWAENQTSASAYLDAQVRFIDETFANSTATWKMVVAHHPVYTSSDHYAEDHTTLRNALRPVLDKHNVAVYFNGHDHGLEEHSPVSAKSKFILSGGGAQVRPTMIVRDTGFKFHYGEQGGFVSFSANKTALLVQFLDFRGNLLYETSQSQSNL